MMIKNYCHVFAAKKFVEGLIAGDEYKWMSPTSLRTDRGMMIKSDQLEEIMEYDFSKEQQEWDFPIPESTDIKQFLRSEEEVEAAKEARNERLGVKKRQKVERPARTPRPSRDGLISVQDICSELKIDPREARAALRKGKIEKPEVGWAGNAEWADGIRKFLKENVK